MARARNGVTDLTTPQDRAEALFKRKQAQSLDGQKARAEYEQRGSAMREKTARLRALRLARDAVGTPHDSRGPSARGAARKA